MTSPPAPRRSANGSPENPEPINPSNTTSEKSAPNRPPPLAGSPFHLEPDWRSLYIPTMNKKNGTGIFFIKLLRITLDLLTISLLFSALVLLRHHANPNLPLDQYFRLWPVLFLFWIVFEKMGLYEGATIHSGASLGPTEELRRLFYVTSAIFITVGFANFYYRPDDYLFSRIVLLSTYVCCLFSLPFNRILFRKICARLGYRGVPAVLIGSGKTAKTLFDSMAAHPEYGLRPIGYFADTPSDHMPDEAPFLGKLSEVPEKTKSLLIKYAILAMDGEIDQKSIKQYGSIFPHLLFVPEYLLQGH